MSESGIVLPCAVSILQIVVHTIPFFSASDIPYISHNPDAAERVIQKYLKLMSLHRELASLYRTKSSDRRTIANLWYYIDGLEIDLRAEGVKL